MALTTEKARDFPGLCYKIALRRTHTLLLRSEGVARYCW